MFIDDHFSAHVPNKPSAGKAGLKSRSDKQNPFKRIQCPHLAQRLTHLGGFYLSAPNSFGAYTDSFDQPAGLEDPQIVLFRSEPKDTQAYISEIENKPYNKIIDWP